MIHAMLVDSTSHVEASGFILSGIKGIFTVIGAVPGAILCR